MALAIAFFRTRNRPVTVVYLPVPRSAATESVSVTIVALELEEFVNTYHRSPSQLTTRPGTASGIRRSRLNGIREWP